METLSFARVNRRVVPLHSEDGEVPAVCGQQHALVEHQGQMVGEPLDGNVGILGVTVKGHLFPVFYGSGLADRNGGPGRQFCTGRKSEKETEAETQTEEDQAKHSHRGTQRDWTAIARRQMSLMPGLKC